jgi:hypothetical protein
MLNKKISKLDAFKTVEPLIIPPTRQFMIEFMKTVIIMLPPGVFGPIIEVIMPIIEQYSDFDSKVDSLVKSLFEQEFVIDSIIFIMDNTVIKLTENACKMFNPPEDANSLNINENAEDDDGGWL